MGHKDIAWESVSNPNRRNKVKPQKGKVCEVILGKWLFFQMGMDKPETP